MTVVTRSLYLGSFIGDWYTDTTWLNDKVHGWAELARALMGVARKHLQSDYAELQKSLQQEWAFVKWVTPEIGNAFIPVKKALNESFMLALFQSVGKGILGQGVTRLTAKQAGLDLPDPNMTAPES